MSCVPPICPIRAGLVRDFDAAFHTIEPHGHSMREGVSRCLTAIFRIIVPEYAQSLYDGGRCESRSEEHTSELQSLMRISYAVFCLKKKKRTNLYNIQKQSPYNILQYIEQHILRSRDTTKITQHKHTNITHKYINNNSILNT